MRLIYSLFLYAFSPLILLYLKKRGLKNPAYNNNWHERFGLRLKNPAHKPIIWLYSVSVGETIAMAKLIELLETEKPEYQILITTMTPTGRATACRMYPQALVHYIPYDLPHAVRNFYQTFKPSVGLIMETEIWPNIAYYANKFNIPLLLTNARLSLKSFNAYHKIRFLIKPVLNNFTEILCQDELSSNHFQRLGFGGKLRIIGNMKFDLNSLQDFTLDVKTLMSQIHHKKIIAFASTRDGDEELILNNLPPNFPYLVIIIPRHPERFSVVEHLIKEKGLSYQKRTDNEIIKNGTQIFIGNTLGEMLLFYTMCDIAIIGGSFLNHGGQNPIEAIFVEKPVIFGPSMFNFNAVAKSALAENCAVQVHNISECFNEINEILTNASRYKTLQENCLKFIHAHRGASNLVFVAMAHYLQ